jgi:hypothetical protein
MSGIIKDDNREEFWIFCFLLQRKKQGLTQHARIIIMENEGGTAHLPIKGDNCFFGFYCLSL